MAIIRSSRWALTRGQKLARAGKLEDALAAFETAGDSSDPHVLLHHALTLARAGRGDEAVGKSAQAAAAAPDDVVPAAFNAYLLLRFGALDAAEAELERAGKLSASNPIVPSLGGALAILRGRAADGCEALLAGPMTDNLEILGWVLAIVERAVFEAVGTDSGAIPPEPEKGAKRDVPPAEVPALSARAASKKGQRLLEAGKPKSAVKYWEHAVSKKPDDADQRALYGAALFEAGEFERAEAELARAPEKGPLCGVAQFYRAANAYRLGRYDTVLQLLDSLPLVGDAFFYQEWCDYLRGMTLVAMGRTDAAAGHLAVFIDTEPGVVARRLKKAITLLGEDEPCSTSP